MTDISWNAAQVPPRCEREVRDYIEGTDRGTFLPTHVRGWVAQGSKRVREHPLVPGYVFFALAEGDNGFGAEIHFDEDKKARVLGRVVDRDENGRPECRISRLMMLHATGSENNVRHRVNGQFAKKNVRRRRRPNRRNRTLRYLAYINSRPNHDSQPNQ